MENDDEGEDDEGPIELFGIHRLQLAPGSRSGYVGVANCLCSCNYPRDSLQSPAARFALTRT